LPPRYRQNPFELVAAIEQLAVKPDQMAQVIIDEDHGVVIITKDVKISTVAIAHQNLTIKITETPQVSEPGPLSKGRTVLVPRSRFEVDEGILKNWLF